MVEQQVMEDLRQALDEKRYADAQKALVDLNPVDVAMLLAQMTDREQGVAFRLLPKDEAVAVFEQMEPEDQVRLLQTFQAGAPEELFRELSPDDQARLLDEVPAMVARKLIQSLDPAERQRALEVLGYAEGTAGRSMTPDYVELRPDMTVAVALERIRRQAPSKETIYVVYVIDTQRRLVGVVSLRDLVIAQPEQTIDSIMTTDVKFVFTSTDREDAARMLGAYDLLAIPVVDREERLVGIVTWDDAHDILEEETTEDIYKMAGVGIRERADSPILESAKRRVPWLMFNMAWAFVGASIISVFQETISTVTALVIFIPVIAGMAGNSGIQTSMVTVRSMALGEIDDVRAILLKEWALGLLKGLIFGGILGLVAWIWQGNPILGAVAGISLFLNMVIASLAGVLLPALFRRLRIDPATIAGVFNTMLTDFFGFLIYLGLATLFISWLV